MKIVFASGKGGTGKTTIATNLAWFLSYSNQRVQYIDCDVEEPNGYLFLKPDFETRDPAKLMVPLIDQERCTSCGQCGKACRFHALVNLPGQTLLLPQMCHGCCLCTLVCPERAISAGAREIGWIEKGSAILNIPFVHGVLNVREPMAGPLIEQVKAHAIGGYISIIDAPPGTSCPVVKTMSDADLILLVTEPTPFGLHDLRAACIVTRSLAIPVAVVVNREQTKFEQLERYLSDNRLPVLGRFPDDPQIAREYSKGNLICEVLPLYRKHFAELIAGIGRMSSLLQRGQEWRIAGSL